MPSFGGRLEASPRIRIGQDIHHRRSDREQHRAKHDPEHTEHLEASKQGEEHHQFIQTDAIADEAWPQEVVHTADDERAHTSRTMARTHSPVMAR